MTLGTPTTRRAASRALAELTGEGIYPPEWVTEVGKAVPGQAWRRYDVFGDDEAIAVTFSYGEAEHGIVVQVDLAGIPVATAIGVSSNAAQLIEAISGNNEEFDRSEKISLAEARGRMLRPAGPDRPRRQPEADPEQHRVPPGGPVPGPPPPGQRRRAPDGLHRGRPRGPRSRSSCRARRRPRPSRRDEASTRFWAEVLTGYSGADPRRAAGPGGPAQARAHPARPCAEYLRPDPRPSAATSSPR